MARARVHAVSPRRLRLLLVATLLCVQLVTVSLVVLGMQRRTNETVEAGAERTLVQLADRVVEQTRRWMEPADTVLRTAARLTRGGVLDTGDDDALERFLLAHLHTLPWLDAAYLGRADGSFVMAGRTGDGLRTKRIDFEPGPDGEPRRRVRFMTRDAGDAVLEDREDADDRYDPRARPWYAVARQGLGEVGWTDPYVFFTSGRPGITAVLAVGRPDGGDAGVLGLDIDMQALSGFVAELPGAAQGAAQGSAMIVDAAGRVAAYSDFDDADASGGAGEAPTVASIGDAALTALFAGHEGGAGDPATGLATVRTTGARAFEVDGVGHLGLARAFSPTRSDTGRDWLLLAQTPVATYAGGIDSLFARGLTTLAAVLALTTAAAAAFVHRMTRPLDRLHRDATVDALTGAWNRSEFERRLGRRIAARRRRDQREALVVVALDLDGFKAVNDELGHAAGDAVLVGVVERLRAGLREHDLVGRLGGDEFALVVGVEPGTDFVAVVERLRAALTSEPFDLPGGPRRVGATAGIAVHEREESVAAVIGRADAALVLGKARAKDRCWLARPTGVPDRHRLCLVAAG